MSTVRKTITVTETQEAWISAQVQAGRFTNDSELIRDLIRREQERASQIEALRQALMEGERSGEPKPFDTVRKWGLAQWRKERLPTGYP